MSFDRAAWYRESRAKAYAKRPDTYCYGGCGGLLPKKPLGRKWCSERCRNAVHHAKLRAERAKGREARHPLAKYIYEAVKDTAPGLCPWCDEPLPKGRKTSCGDPDCTRAYQRAYRVARCEAARAGRPLRQVPCACGCGITFQQDCLQRKYLDDRHYADHRNRLLREERAKNPKPKGRPKGSRSSFMRPFGKRTEPKALRPFYN